MDKEKTETQTKIHPTAIVDASARIGSGVRIGPGAIVEADTTLGDDCELMAHCVIRRYTTLGRRNVVHPFAVLGGEPQDYGHDPAVRSFCRIGDDNVFREGATVNRATGADKVTRVGNHNYFMASAHVGHNVVLGDHCVMVNNSSLGGYAELGDRAILSACGGVHQFCRVGEMALIRGNGGVTNHMPPYCMGARMNLIVGLNVVGLRRAPHISAKDHREISEAFKLLYRRGLSTSHALAEMDARSDWGEAAGKFRDFVRRAVTDTKPYNRGLVTADKKRSR